MEKMKNKEYYVYIYYRLDTNEPFYAGKGKGDYGFCGKLLDGTKLKWMYLLDFLEKCEYTLL